MLGSGDLPGECLLPFRARALEDGDECPILLGGFTVQIGHFGDGSAQQRTTMITGAGMFAVDQRLPGWCETAGNLTPKRRARTIALARRRLSLSHALH